VRARRGAGVTAPDVALGKHAPQPFSEVDERMHREFLASERVRFVGDIVAVVLASSREAAFDAAELVELDYEPLPFVTDVRPAARDEVLLYPHLGTNTCIHTPPKNRDARLLDGCEVVEEITYDEDGNPQNSNLVTYGFPGPTELPRYELAEMETPTPINPLGAKGIGESGTIGATLAVHNAVLDALAPLGVRYVEMPANGERVWRAIRNAAGGGRP